MDLGGASVPVQSFARIRHDAVPAIREAVRDLMLVVPAGDEPDVAALASRMGGRLDDLARVHRGPH